MHVQIKMACASVEVLQAWCQGQRTVIEHSVSEHVPTSPAQPLYASLLRPQGAGLGSIPLCYSINLRMVLCSLIMTSNLPELIALKAKNW